MFLKMNKYIIVYIYHQHKYLLVFITIKYLATYLDCGPG
jgi:hypothetical protein